MTIEQILDDIECEQLYDDYEKQWKKKHAIAIQRNLTSQKFKDYIAQFLNRKYSEDQWVIDYQLWVDTLKPDQQEPINQWAEFHYQGDWDAERANADQK